jgi:hypothetical protein
LIIGAWVCSLVVKLKRVALDDEALVISNYFRRIRVPLGQVRAGGFEDAWVGVGLVVGPVGIVERRPFVALVFEKRTPFGRIIDFIPRSKESLDLLRGRLGWKLPAASTDPDRSELADELRGRGTV